MINGVNRGGIYVAQTLTCFPQGVTHEWISYLFDMSVVFWIAVLSLLSSWDYMIVRVKLLVYDVWSAKEDRIGFLSVGVDIFDWLYLKERPIYFSMVTVSTIKQIYDKWDYVRKLNKIGIFQNVDE